MTNWEDILKIFGAMTIFCYVVMIPFAIYLSRRTKFFEELNNWIDKKVEGKGSAKPGAAAPASVPESEPEKQETVRPEKNNPNSYGIASFELRVHDIYYCYLSSANRDSRLYEVEWTTDNEFVGTIDENAVFTGNKTGKVVVRCMRKGDAMDRGTDMYEIDVVPSNPDWFAEKIYRSLLERKQKDKVLVALLPRKIVSEEPTKNLIRYEGDDADKKLSVQFNEYNEIERVLFELRTTKSQDFKSMIDELNERFEECELTGSGIRIWTHRITDESKDEVDLYAFLKQTPDGKAYLGIGQFWREYGEIEEFQKNIRMAERMFYDLLPGIEPSDVKAVIKVKEPVRHLPDKTETKKQETNQKNDKTDYVPKEKGTPTAETPRQEPAGDDGSNGNESETEAETPPTDEQETAPDNETPETQAETFPPELDNPDVILGGFKNYDEGYFEEN